MPQPTCTLVRRPPGKYFGFGLTVALNQAPSLWGLLVLSPGCPSGGGSPRQQGCPSSLPESHEGVSSPSVTPGALLTGDKVLALVLGVLCSRPLPPVGDSLGALASGAGRRRSGAAAPADGSLGTALVLGGSPVALGRGWNWAHLGGSGQPAALRPHC